MTTTEKTIKDLETRFMQLQNHIKNNKKDLNAVHRLFGIKSKIIKFQKYQQKSINKENKNDNRN